MQVVKHSKGLSADFEPLSYMCVFSKNIFIQTNPKCKPLKMDWTCYLGVLWLLLSVNRK